MLSGYVCLLGAGPGDAGLITRIGLEYLKRADVVLYDQLIPMELLLETRPGCEWIDVGKRCGKPSMAQDEINRLLIAKAKAGHFVIRLKGGDPFLFGRGGEEAEALARAGIPYIVIPGISSCLSVPAAAGIPVTHRNVAHSVLIRTGRRGKPARVESLPTQVVLMSLNTLKEVSDTLMAEGYSPETPAAVISRGTTPFQRVVSGTLRTVASLAEEVGLAAPALLVAGEAAALSRTLEWKSRLPLSGKRIVWVDVQSEAASGCLEDMKLLGAEVIRLPVLAVRPQPQPQLARILAETVGYSWLVFTSQNAVRIFFEAMLAKDKDWNWLASSRIAAVGDKTAEALKTRGRNPDLAAGGNSRSLWERLMPLLRSGDRVALCQAEKTLPYLSEGLDKIGAEYRRFVLYHLKGMDYPREWLECLCVQSPDVTVFTAPSAVVQYFELLESKGLNPDPATRYACIGRETEARLRQLGHAAWLVAAEPRLDRLARQLIEALRSECHVSKHSLAPVAANPVVAGDVH